MTRIHEVPRETPGLGPEAVVRPLRFAGDDVALLAGLHDGQRAAAAELYDRYRDHVRRVLVRLIGVDDELDDLAQEVFLAALRSVGSARDGAKLKAWLTAVTVHTARGCLRRRNRRRWLSFLEPALVPEEIAHAADHESREMLRGAHAVLERLPVDERLAFCLRHIEGLELGAVAEACGVSLATIKRRLARAEGRFTLLAGRHPALEARLAGQGRAR